MRMLQVDAFTDRLFSGNPAAVLVLDNWLDDDLMLSIAAENNLAETAFVMPNNDGGWKLRWFTPVHEVDFCGHATLATAHVLATEYGVSGTMKFNTRVGELCVDRDGDKYLLDMPRIDPEEIRSLPSEIADILTHEPVKLFRNFENFFCDLGSEHAVRKFVPNLQRIELLGSVGLVVTGQGNGTSGAAFVSRYFAPGAGIPEDPVTGSIHATLVPYWAGKLGGSRFMAYQASQRGGWLDCEMTSDRIYLRGNAVTFMDASIRNFS